jgi:hypothetical protein
MMKIVFGVAVVVLALAGLPGAAQAQWWGGWNHSVRAERRDYSNSQNSSGLTEQMPQYAAAYASAWQQTQLAQQQLTQAEAQVHVAQNLARQQYQAAPEMRLARQTLDQAIRAYHEARQAAVARVADDPAYQAAQARAQGLADYTDSIRAQPDVRRSEIIALAYAVLQSREQAARIENQALAQAEGLPRLHEQWMAAAQKLGQLQAQETTAVRQNNDVAQAQRALDDARKQYAQASSQLAAAEAAYAEGDYQQYRASRNYDYSYSYFNAPWGAYGYHYGY